MTAPISAAELAGLTPFRDCSPAELDACLRLLTPIEASAGDPLLHEGGHDRQLLIVLHGDVLVSSAGGLAGRVGPGDVLGELSMLNGGTRSAAVTAATDVVVLAASDREFQELMRIGPVAARLRAIADARRATPTRLVEAASVPVPRQISKHAATGAGLLARGDRGRPVRMWAAIGGAVVVIGGVFASVILGETATPVDVDALLADLRATPSAAVASGESAPAVAGTSAAPMGPDAALAGTSADPAVTARAGLPGSPIAVTEAPSTAPETGQASGEPQTGGTRAAPSSPAASAFAPPAPGIYEYATSGYETISVFNGRHDYPARTYSVIRRSEGCGWTIEHRLIEEHIDRAERCSSDEVWDISDGSEITFFDQTSTYIYRCSPPTALSVNVPPGTRGSATCATDAGDTITYDATYVGPEDVTVGSGRVETAHLRIAASFDGSARGTSTIELWLATGTGLPVRVSRNVTSMADSPFGEVEYREDVTFELVSITPRT